MRLMARLWLRATFWVRPIGKTTSFDPRELGPLKFDMWGGPAQTSRN